MGTNPILKQFDISEDDLQKEVVITFQRDGQSLVVTVRDEGPGLDPESIPDPRSPENLMRESGRGIFICRSFMDEVDIDTALGKGTTVRLVKRKADPGGE